MILPPPRTTKILLHRRAVADWSPTRLAFSPGPNQWSAAQVFDHMVRVETSILASARATLLHPHRIGAGGKLGYLFIERVFNSDRQVKAPDSVPQIQPLSHLDLPQVPTRWSEARLDLADFLPKSRPSSPPPASSATPSPAGWTYPASSASSPST